MHIVHVSVSTAPPVGTGGGGGSSGSIPLHPNGSSSSSSSSSAPSAARVKELVKQISDLRKFYIRKLREANGTAGAGPPPLEGTGEEEGPLDAGNGTTCLSVFVTHLLFV